MRVRAVPILLTLLLGACAGTRPNRDPVGEVFPSVVGESLDGREVRLPGDVAGRPVLLLVGYVQDAQFDIDRWLLGLLQSGTDLRILEVPTIEGLAAGVAAGWIDAGMRRGIPEEDWPGVVTVYGDAAAITALTGTENPRNARVLLLDGNGRIVRFHDRGYSPRVLLEFLEAASTIR